jgi:hypothetical protein
VTRRAILGGLAQTRGLLALAPLGQRPASANVPSHRFVRASGGTVDENLRSWPLRVQLLRGCGNARRVRGIAAADRRAGRDAAKLGGNDAGDPVGALNPNEKKYEHGSSIWFL